MIQCVLLVKARPLHGRVDWRGLQVSIENRVGSVRSGIDPDGNPWETTMLYDYGYIRLTEGQDGEHVDCFLGPDRYAPQVFCITTRVPPDFVRNDEQKCMLGFPTAEAAKQAFLAQYTDPRHFGTMHTLPFDQFKRVVLGTRGNARWVRA